MGGTGASAQAKLQLGGRRQKAFMDPTARMPGEMSALVRIMDFWRAADNPLQPLKAPSAWDLQWL